jgi:hypothetical protein
MNAREHQPYHERRLEQQTLDALLRIEELLANLNEMLAGPRGPAAPEEEPEVVEIATADLKDGKPSVSIKTNTGRKQRK